MNRRDFLKMLGVGVVVSALPVSAGQPSPLPTVAIIDDAIDGPITRKLPFGWLEINGRQMEIGDCISIHWEHSCAIYDGDQRSPLLDVRGIEFSTPDHANGDQLVALLFSGKECAFKIRMPGVRGCVGGVGIITNINTVCSSSSRETWATIAIVGQLSEIA